MANRKQQILERQRALDEQRRQEGQQPMQGAGPFGRSLGGNGQPGGLPLPTIAQQEQLVNEMGRQAEMDGLIPGNRAPVMGNPGMGAGMGQPGMPGMGAMQQDPAPREIRAVRSEDAEAAYQLGAKMGAQALIGGGMEGQQRQMGQPMTKERSKEAEDLLMRYKTGKASVDRRIVNSQDWWKLRNWPQIEDERGTRGATEVKSPTAWLWNCIAGKHADAMDSFPEPVILPRMPEDKAEAQILTDIVPVVLQMNGFEDTYDRCMWQKFLEGTGAYHIGGDKTKLGGIGDISITKVNMLNLYWEPGVDNIQDSENLFYIRIEDNRRLEQQYPQLKGKLKNAYLTPKEYRRDDTVPMDNKSVVVDWYYHTWYGPRKVLHFCQFVNEEILYSTENNGETDGLYTDGEYPFELDPLFKVEGSPAGYGYIDIGKGCQTDIDTINQAMVQNAVVTSTPRFFLMGDGGLNEEEFADWSKPFVHTGSGLGEDQIRAIQVSGIQGNALSMLERKIDELKFVTGNTDVDNGGTPSGVTAASAIAALQERSGRTSKDSTRAAYRCYNRIVTKVIERIRQFYDIPRQFRILGQNGQEKFVEYNNARLQDQQIEGGIGLEAGYRKPVFDIDVRSERETAYTRVAQNELAIQFLQLGVFNPQMTDQSMMLLDMMDFKGKEELMQKVEQQGTMQQVLMQIGQIAMALAQKYQPEVAEQLGMVMQQVGMDMGGLPGAGGEPGQATMTPPDDAMEAPGNPQEHALVRKARTQADQSSRPQ